MPVTYLDLAQAQVSINQSINDQSGETCQITGSLKDAMCLDYIVSVAMFACKDKYTNA